MSLRASCSRGMSNGSTSSSSGLTSTPPCITGKFDSTRFYDLDIEKVLNAMEKGQKIYKLILGKRWEQNLRLYLGRETRQLLIQKYDTVQKQSKSLVVDIRHVKDVQILEYKLTHMRIIDKWKRDKELTQFDPSKILIILYGTCFVLNNWILLFETPDACKLWIQGLQHLIQESYTACHPLLVERWLRKEFYALANPSSLTVSAKHMKPFVQGRLQCKIQSRHLQELVEEQMAYEAFANAYRRLIHVHSLFSDRFAAYSDDGYRVDFIKFLRFLLKDQKDDLGSRKDLASEFLRRYLKDVDVARDTTEPYLTVQEFVDFLFSRENSVWDPFHDEVCQNMDLPLSSYWIASSHNTYLTGDQLKSESSLEAYAKALLMGCRCIELDCWPGQKRGTEADVIIYHGYTITTKVALRDVLFTIKEYAFVTSEFPVILSIEDNCSVEYQRIMARDFNECLGDVLLTEPLDWNELCLPSPNMLKRKVILKHKKLPAENDKLLSSAVSLSTLDESDQDMMSKTDFLKKGVLQMLDENGIWHEHIFILFSDKLCYSKDHSSLNETNVNGGSADTVSQMGEDEQDDFAPLGLRPDEMHITEEWFHGKLSRDDAVRLLTGNRHLGDGIFLIRESNTFVGDFSLSFYYNRDVHHCRIKTKMVEGEKRYYFLDAKVVDTLYELITFYMENPLSTPHFKTQLLIPCPQPQPHLNEPWFAGDIGKNKAEEMLNAYREDGAFLIRYSTGDDSVFVLSIRVDGEIFHYRLKRDGRLFLVNQTIFENLNMFVKYYQEHELVRGICLKYPVNAESIENYVRSDVSYTKEGCYMDLNTVEQEVKATAKFDYTGRDSNELSFPAGAVINVLRKDDSYLWQGKYNNRVGWFLASFVKLVGPIVVTEPKDYGTLELAGCFTERIAGDLAVAKPYVFRVCQASSHREVRQCTVATNSHEDMVDWINTLLEATKNASDKVDKIKSKEKVLRIASELSNLVVYCQAVPFDPDRIPGNFYEMCSFSESKLQRLLEKGLARFNRNQLSRVYPQGTRVRSNNFNPIPMWNSGCHMVALNYQTPDKPMQLNVGRFLANGACGYVLKPEFLNLENFDPDYPGNYLNPLTLTIEVIAGRHLCRLKDRSRGGIVSPCVEIEVLGISLDYRCVKTKAVGSDGLHPVWNQQFEFSVLCPELALIRFCVADDDFVGAHADPFIGQAVYPVNCLRAGYRSVCLKNDYSEPLELASILVHVDIRRVKEDEEKFLNSEFVGEEILAAVSPKIPKKTLSSDSIPVSQTNCTEFGENETSENSTPADSVAVKKKSSGMKRLEKFFKGITK